MADMERVAQAIRAFEKGEMVVVTDDDDRENEGDLIVAATKITPEQMGLHHSPQLGHRLCAHDRRKRPSPQPYPNGCA